MICLHLVPIFGLSYGNPLGIDLDSSSSSFSPLMASFELEYAGDDREVKGNKDFDVEEGVGRKRKVVERSMSLLLLLIKKVTHTSRCKFSIKNFYGVNKQLHQ